MIDQDPYSWNRECVVCGYKWLGTETDECRVCVTTNYDKWDAEMGEREKMTIVVIWKTHGDVPSYGTWHIADFKTYSAASSRSKSLKNRSDVEYVRIIDITRLEEETR